MDERSEDYDPLRDMTKESIIWRGRLTGTP